LDVFRFLAAMGVFLAHAHSFPNSSGALPDIYVRHQCVVVFFVISGYVIAASATRPGRTLANYGADRLARLYSVVIPALLLTYCLDAIGSMLCPAVYSYISPQWQPVRLLVNMFYCQQIWFLCVNPSSNTPFWSLGYEFWYYVLFGVWFFVGPKWKKSLLLLAVSLFIGPKILLLLPAWAIGAIAFRATQGYRCSYRSSLVLFVATGLVMAAALYFADQPGLSNSNVGKAPWFYSANFLADNVFAVIVALHFFCCGLLSKHLASNLEPYWIVKTIRWMSGHTFSLYVYHLPILLFIRSIGNYNPEDPWEDLVAIVITLLIIVGLSKITEEKYPAIRIPLRRWMENLARRFEGSAVETDARLAPRPIPAGTKPERN
jgi:peptidoglycan/LPS O-acetylase OafA/YrhL